MRVNGRTIFAIFFPCSLVMVLSPLRLRYIIDMTRRVSTPMVISARLMSKNRLHNL